MSADAPVLTATASIPAQGPPETADGNGWLVPGWVAAVRSTAMRLDGELARTTRDGAAPGGAAAAASVRAAIRQARESASRPQLAGFFRPLRRVADWWTGRYADRAWSDLHIAGQSLLSVQDQAVVKAQLSDMAAVVVTSLGPDDLRVRDYLATLQLLAPAGRAITAADREQLRAIRQACDSASDSAHGDARAYRNNLIMASGLLALVLGIVAIAAAADPAFRSVFAVAKASPGGWYVLELELAASLSGLTGAVLALKNYAGFQYSYGLSFVQAILKGSVGGATGLLGVLLVRSGIVSSLTLRSVAATFAWAVVFGYAQYLFTRLIDQQARAVLKSAGSRSDPDITPQAPRGAATPAMLTTDSAHRPHVTGMSPAAGDEAGGTEVTISGSGFTGATGVSFGSAAAAGTTIDSDAQITAVSPPGSGTVAVTVEAFVGTSPATAETQFTYLPPPAPATPVPAAPARARRLTPPASGGR
jgi:hypothetical protein